MKYFDHNRTAWNRNSARYQGGAGLSVDTLDIGDERCPTIDDLGLLPDVKHKQVIELGCGGGNIGICLAKRGARVHAVDISENQLAYARKKAATEHVEVLFEECAIENYVFREKYDIAISICAFQYVHDLGSVFRNVFDNLHRDGYLLFSTDHPAFYTAAFTTIWKHEKRNVKYKSETAETWKWEDDDDFEFTTFLHPIEFYINTLVAIGFSIDALHELTVDHEKPENEEEELETIFPRYLVVKATKR